MIWTSEPEFCDASSVVASRVMDAVETACPGQTGLDRTRLQEIAQGVARHVTDADGAAPSDLLGLACRALESLGEPDAARRLRIMRAGLVKPGAWSVAGNVPVWTLDLLLLAGPASIEIGFYRGLNAAVDAMLEVWQETRGAGVLGLKNAGPAVRRLLGGRPSPRREARMVAEMTDACAARIEAAGRARGWGARPWLMHVNR